MLIVSAQCFDVDQISEFIEAFELDMLVTSIQDAARSEEAERDELLLDRSFECLNVIQVILVNNAIRSDIEVEISNTLQELYHIIHDFCTRNDEATPDIQRGRPTLAISSSQLEGLISLGFTYRRMAEIMGISEATLLRRRRELGLTDSNRGFATISNAELDTMVQTVISAHPNSGERMIIGSLRATGLRIQRWRVRDSIGRVDPLGPVIRGLTKRIQRRSYSVPCPNALW